MGEEHADTLLTMNSLGELFMATGDYAAAQPLHERCLAVRRRTLGDDHPNTIVSALHLAALRSHQGKLLEAQLLFEEALAVQRATLGDTHRLTVRTIGQLADLLSKAVRKLPPRARAPHAQQLHRVSTTNLRWCRARVMTGDGLGNHDSRQRNFRAARPLYEEVVGVHRRERGEADDVTLAATTKLAEMHNNNADYANAYPREYSLTSLKGVDVCDGRVELYRASAC
jgi:tetratricopeptide (TPR) repeat protein